MNENDRPLIRAAAPDLRIIIYYGGPLDGSVHHVITIEPGYVDTGGALAIWHTINTELLWSRKGK